jgi:hypothetical protein
LQYLRGPWSKGCGEGWTTLRRACSLWLPQLICLDTVDPKFLSYEVHRSDQGWDGLNGHLSNVGLAVAVTKDSCPDFPVHQTGCVFVDASSIQSDIGGYVDWEYSLVVGCSAGSPPNYAEVQVMDEPLASLCQTSEDNFWGAALGAARGWLLLPAPSSARDHTSGEVTEVLLQLTRRRQLVRGKGLGWGWGGKTHTRDRNSYRVETQPRVIKHLTVLDDPALAYPVLAPGDVSSVRAP